MANIFIKTFPSKHFRQNIVTLCYSCYFWIFSIFNFFQIILIPLFLARYDQYFIMFKDSNVFKFTNLPFKTKYNNAVVYSVSCIYLFSRRKQEKKDCWNNSLIKSTVYLFLFRQNLIIFEGSSSSQMESYFTGELNLGGSLNSPVNLDWGSLKSRRSKFTVTPVQIWQLKYHMVQPILNRIFQISRTFLKKIV